MKRTKTSQVSKQTYQIAKSYSNTVDGKEKGKSQDPSLFASHLDDDYLTKLESEIMGDYGQGKKSDLVEKNLNQMIDVLNIRMRSLGENADTRLKLCEDDLNANSQKMSKHAPKISDDMDDVIPKPRDSKGGHKENLVSAEGIFIDPVRLVMRCKSQTETAKKLESKLEESFGVTNLRDLNGKKNKNNRIGRNRRSEQQNYEARKPHRVKLEKDLQSAVDSFVTRSVLDENLVFTAPTVPIEDPFEFLPNVESHCIFPISIKWSPNDPRSQHRENNDGEFCPELLLRYGVERVYIPGNYSLFRWFARQLVFHRYFIFLFWLIKVKFFQTNANLEDESFLLEWMAKEYITIIQLMASRAHEEHEKDFSYRYLPYILSSAVVSGFYYLCPGSRHLYTKAFKKTVYLQVVQIMFGVQLCPLAVKSTWSRYFPDEIHDEEEGEEVGESMPIQASLASGKKALTIHKNNFLATSGLLDATNHGNNNTNNSINANTTNNASNNNNTTTTTTTTTTNNNFNNSTSNNCPSPMATPFNVEGVNGVAGGIPRLTRSASSSYGPRPSLINSKPGVLSNNDEVGHGDSLVNVDSTIPSHSHNKMPDPILMDPRFALSLSPSLSASMIPQTQEEEEENQYRRTRSYTSLLKIPTSRFDDANVAMDLLQSVHEKLLLDRQFSQTSPSLLKNNSDNGHIIEYRGSNNEMEPIYVRKVINEGEILEHHYKNNSSNSSSHTNSHSNSNSNNNSSKGPSNHPSPFRRTPSSIQFHEGSLSRRPTLIQQSSTRSMNNVSPRRSRSSSFADDEWDEQTYSSTNSSSVKNAAKDKGLTNAASNNPLHRWTEVEVIRDLMATDSLFRTNLQPLLEKPRHLMQVQRQNQETIDGKSVSPLIQEGLHAPTASSGVHKQQLRRTVPIHWCPAGGSDTYHRRQVPKELHDDLSNQYDKMEHDLKYNSWLFHHRKLRINDKVESACETVLSSGSTKISRFSLDLIKKRQKSNGNNNNPNSSLKSTVTTKDIAETTSHAETLNDIIQAAHLDDTDMDEYIANL